MDRRGFLTGSLAGAGTVVGLAAGDTRTMAAPNASTGNRPRAVLKLASQESRIPGDSLREKVGRLESWGGVGVELHGRGQKLLGRIPEARQAVKGTPVKVAAICSGSFGLIDPDPGRREAGAEELKTTLRAAGELGAVGVIVVPAFNHHKQLPHKEARRVLVDLLGGVGEFAEKCGTQVLLEPLNRKEAYFLRQLADAASICRDVGSPGVSMMGDFYHMFFEETSDAGAFLSAGSSLRHVHLGSRTRKLPGQDDRRFVDGFRGLKMIGYRDYCSLECGCKGDREVETPKAFRFLEAQWKEATV